MLGIGEVVGAGPAGLGVAFCVLARAQGVRVDVLIAIPKLLAGMRLVPPLFKIDQQVYH